LTIQRFSVQEFLLGWWKSREMFVDLQRWCLLVATFQSGGVIQRFVVVFPIAWWEVWGRVLILSLLKRFWVRVERRKIAEKSFVQSGWLGIVDVVLRWRWVVLTYARMAIQDCLNKSFTCFFTNQFCKYRVSKALNNSVLRESDVLGLVCKVTILGGPHMTWWCRYCRCSIHSYNVVLAIARSNKSPWVPHSTVQSNEN